VDGVSKKHEQEYFPYMESFKKGLAVGFHDIKRDLVHFEFSKTGKTGDFERFAFPTFDVVGKLAHYNGLFYEAKVSDLRKLAEKNK